MDKVLRPVNQKSVYHSNGDVYEKVMNDETITDPITRYSLALKALHEMNATYIAELKRWEIDQSVQASNVKAQLRIIETKNFDNISIDDKKQIFLEEENKAGTD